MGGIEVAAKKKYNWDELFKRESSLLERWVDYSCSQSNMIQQIRNEASKRGLRIRISDLGTQIILKIVGGRDEVRDTTAVAITS